MANDKFVSFNKDFYVLLRYKDDIKEQIRKSLQEEDMKDNYLMGLFYTINLGVLLNEDNYYDSYFPLFFYLENVRNYKSFINEEEDDISGGLLTSIPKRKVEELIIKTPEFLKKIGVLYKLKDNVLVKVEE